MIMLMKKLVKSLYKMKVRFGSVEFGRLLLMIVWYMVMERIMVVENLICFLEFVGRKKMVMCRNVMVIIGKMMFIV